jgi:ABC-type uncharacterized transport system auxiliary subunit
VCSSAGGLVVIHGAGAKCARLVTYDLTVLRAAEAAEKPSAAQLVVRDPTALAALDTERVQSALANGAFANLADAQWSDAWPSAKPDRISPSVGRAVNEPILPKAALPRKISGR